MLTYADVCLLSRELRHLPGCCYACITNITRNMTRTARCVHRCPAVKELYCATCISIAYVSMRQHTSAYVSIAYVSIRRCSIALPIASAAEIAAATRLTAYVSIREHT